ncbi:MAG TPA: dihydrolipoamide acetyltransferase family protein [Enhygromyxa sp.]|nr:dihydrolipoamide acetyltransferase family protein [Enhygromyxa sp.]
MATVVELPRLSDTMEEGVVAKWRVAVGDKVKRGQIIAEIETDKATMEFESFDAGHVLALVASEGETLPLGAPIAVLGQQGEDPAPALASFGGKPSTPPAPPEARAEVEAEVDRQTTAAEAPASPVTAPRPAAAPAPKPAPATIERGSERIPASPVARKLAREHGLELAAITGSGPHGRVVKADVEAAVREGVGKPAAAEAAPEARTYSAEVDAWGRPYVSQPEQRVRLNQMRKTIARRMSQAKREIPHYYLTVDIDMERAASFRAELNAAIDATKISFNDLIVKAVARALRAFPAMNSAYAETEFIRRGDVHVGVAVAVDDGLVVPVVRYADQKSLEAISIETRDLGKRARKKQLRPDEMTGSTFSVSNLGMFGIEEFAAVVNPGEAGILAVGAIEPRAVVIDGQVVVRKRMRITLSADHRVTDGAVGAQWLTLVKGFLENPIKMLTDPAS